MISEFLKQILKNILAAKKFDTTMKTITNTFPKRKDLISIEVTQKQIDLLVECALWGLMGPNDIIRLQLEKKQLQIKAFGG